MAFRLSIGVLIIFLAMLSGFLLKGDADSLQARQILESLTLQIPVFGKSLAFSLLGQSGSFQLIYVHHIATFTIFIAIVMILSILYLITLSHSNTAKYPIKSKIEINKIEVEIKARL